MRRRRDGRSYSPAAAGSGNSSRRLSGLNRKECSTLTPHCRPRVVEKDEYTAFARRIPRAYARITCTAALADDIDQADSIPATLSVSYL